jgi:hypothetical protein
LFVLVAIGFIDLREPDEPSGIAPDSLGKIMRKVAVDMIVLQHHRVNASVVHFCNHKFRQRRHIVHVWRQELEVVGLARFLPFEAAIPTGAEIDIVPSTLLRGIVRTPQMHFGDNRVIA